jgi:succinate dehydrogenase / fumarate reductase iron-sulfur subunit
VNAHRFIFDSRDTNWGERLDILNDREGVWRCRTIFNCTEACPREIRITKAIGHPQGPPRHPIRQPATSHG